MDDSDRLYKAKAHYMDALEIEPTRGMTHLNLGLLYEAEGDDVNAEIHLHAALNLDMDSIEATATIHHVLAIIKDRAGELYEAKAHYDNAIVLLVQCTIVPVEVYYNAALLSEALGEHGRYEQHLVDLVGSHGDVYDVQVRLDRIRLQSALTEENAKVPLRFVQPTGFSRSPLPGHLTPLPPNPSKFKPAVLKNPNTQSPRHNAQKAQELLLRLEDGTIGGKVDREKTGGKSWFGGLTSFKLEAAASEPIHSSKTLPTQTNSQRPGQVKTNIRAWNERWAAGSPRRK